MNGRRPVAVVPLPAAPGDARRHPGGDEAAARLAFRRKVFATLLAFGLKLAYAAFVAWLRARRGGRRGRRGGGGGNGR